jgi:hypothetical protein
MSGIPPTSLYTLSDDQTEYQLKDRLSFMRFVGAGASRRRNWGVEPSQPGKVVGKIGQADLDPGADHADQNIYVSSTQTRMQP